MLRDELGDFVGDYMYNTVISDTSEFRRKTICFNIKYFSSAVATLFLKIIKQTALKNNVVVEQRQRSLLKMFILTNETLS